MKDLYRHEFIGILHGSSIIGRRYSIYGQLAGPSTCPFMRATKLHAKESLNLDIVKPLLPIDEQLMPQQRHKIRQRPRDRGHQLQVVQD
jgi:hypothetical protein